MPEIVCEECGKRLFHENQDTLKIEEAVHKKFCRKSEDDDYSYMHRESAHTEPMDAERANDGSGKSILKK